MSPKRPVLLLALILGSTGVAAQAEVHPFQVILAGSALGTIEFETDDAGRPAALHGRFDNTPLGVFDGTFEGTSRPVQTEAGEVVLQFLGVTESTRKSRTISVLHEGGQAIEATVSPGEEETELSQVDQVPAGIIDPVEAFGRLVGAGGCPEPFRIYDGRRVVDVAVQSSEEADGVLTCHASYEVVAGPGHLSPLGLTSFSMELAYTVGGTGFILSEIDISASIFELRLVR